MADASVGGDIAMLSGNTTEDFELTDLNGKVQHKNQALADVKKEKSTKSWTITEAELATLTDDTAVMKYLLTLTLKTVDQGRPALPTSLPAEAESGFSGRSSRRWSGNDRGCA